MKYLIIGLTAVFSMSAIAHNIEGTLILKGTIKSKVVVNTVKTTCKLKVEKVKNLLVEDSFGNPAYNVRTEISLDGEDMDRRISVKMNKEVWFTNIFTVGTGTEVRDLEYASNDGSKMMIDSEGRVLSVSFLYNSRPINCAF